jgi:hypothetical protein
MRSLRSRPVIHVVLVTDRAGSFAVVVRRALPRYIEGGRIIVSTLATFDHEDEARAFRRALGCIDGQSSERMPSDVAALERHGLAPHALHEALNAK